MKLTMRLAAALAASVSVAAPIGRHPAPMDVLTAFETNGSVRVALRTVNVKDYHTAVLCTTLDCGWEWTPTARVRCRLSRH